MLRGLYTAYTGMLNEQYRMDIMSNNLANADTTGFKKEGSTSQAYSEVMAVKIKDVTENPNTPKRLGNMSLGVKIGETYTDFSQGSLRDTGNTYDIAIGGDGFFNIEFTSKSGETSTKYTRAGSFTLTKDGYLVTKDGDYVLGENGRIQLSTTAGNTVFDESGNIFQDGTLVASLKLTEFEDTNYLTHYGETMWDAKEGAVSKDAENFKIRQGYLEMSNASVVKEMVNMITISRHYESTGMIAQQLNVDNISNNLANVNTTGYKAEVMEFKSLLYQTIQTRTTTANGANKPIGAEVGLGVRNSSITSIFTDGSLLETPGGNTYYTRNGNFVFAVGSEGITLETTDGLPVLDSEGEPIILEDDDIVTSKITVGKDGTLYYPDDKNIPQSLDITIGLWQFNNPAGLSKEGDSLYAVTDASGEEMNEAENENLTKTKLIQGYLEGSNVQIADEMVNLIVAQRAYEMNSKVITTSDEMLQQANQLKR